MATNQITGYGTKLQRWNDVTFVDIAEVTSIQWEGEDRETINVSISSPGNFVNKIQGLIDTGTVVIKQNYTAAGFLLMNQDFLVRGSKLYRIVFPDQSAFDFRAFIIRLPLTFSSKSVLGGSVIMQITSKVMYVEDSTPGGIPIPGGIGSMQIGVSFQVAS